MLIIFQPFFFTILLIYMLPQYYMYKKVSLAFIKAKSKKVLAYFIVFLMLLFPIVEILNHMYNHFLVRILLITSYFYLPFLLYFVLGIALYDVVITITKKKIMTLMPLQKRI